MTMTAKDVIARWETMRSIRSNFESQWQEIADYVKGMRDFNVVSAEQGRKRNVFIYDNTAMQSGDMLASGMHNFLTNTATKWFGVRPEDERLLEDERAITWFDLVEQRMNAVFNRPDARFTPQMHEVYIDLVFYNTAVMFVEDVPGMPVRFSARPLPEIYIAEDASGTVDTVVRHYRLTHRQAIQQFGAQQLPKLSQQLEHHPEDKTEFLHLVMPRTDPLPGNFGPRGMPWQSVHVSLEERKIVREGGFHELPYLVGRWEKDSGETYGRGPGINALPDAKMLNAMAKTLIKAGQKIVDPPLLVADDGVIHPLRMQPGGVNIIKSSSFSPDPIRSLPIEGSFPIGNQFYESRKETVRAAFLHDLLQILRPQTTPITATQTIEIVERAQALIAPVLGRMQVELLEPMIERVFGILNRAGFFPPAPDFLQDREIKIQYISPVARAQKASEVRALMDSLQIVSNMAAAQPDVLDNYDLDEAARIIAKNTDIPASIVRPQREVQRMRQARAAALAEQQQREDLSRVADAVGKAGPTSIEAIEKLQAQGSA